MKDTCEMYVFDELKGVYIRFGEVVIKEQSEILCPEISTHKVNEIIEKLRRRTFVDGSKFDKDHIFKHRKWSCKYYGPVNLLKDITPIIYLLFNCQ